jgi:hypothetical protein
MPYSSCRSYRSPSELLLCDVASLLLTSELITSSLVALRPECQFSAELTDVLNSIIALCDAGESRIQRPLMESNLVLPATTDTSASALITGFFTRLPSADDPNVFATELVLNLRLLAQHVELKSRLASEEAEIVGLHELSQELASWSSDWRICGRDMSHVPQRPTIEDPSHRFSVSAFAMPQGI